MLYNIYMTKKEIITLVILVLVVIALVVFGIMTKSDENKPSGDVENVDVKATTTIPESGYSSEVPENIEITTPKIEAPLGGNNNNATIGLFEMSVSKDGFSPSQLAVKNGNVVQINLTAVDGNYDWELPWFGLYYSISKGETKNISFQATSPGTLDFYCRDFCPAGGKIAGKIIITQ
jgi:heme/copper-type cytochrome/quinol oxidase subunit 2